MTGPGGGPTVAVVGGGITGLAAAWEVVAGHADAGTPPRVVVLEAGDRLGGKITAVELGGGPVDGGADAFVARAPAGVELCRELGLGDELEAPAANRAFVWTRGRLRPLPEGLVLGVPSDLVGLARSGAVSVPGLARAALDLVLPATPPSGDPSVGELVTARFGREVQERVVDPLLGGIHAGRSERLSAAATAPQLAAAAGRHRSLLLGLRATAPQGAAGAGPAAPVFLAVAGGMDRLVTRLARELRSRGAELRTGSPVQALERGEGGRGWALTTPDGVLAADAVVVAVPAPVAAGLLAQLAPAAAAGLGGVEHASVALVLLAYPGLGAAVPPGGSGFLVPRVDGRLMTACSWYTSKWPGRRPEGEVVMRVSVGRWAQDPLGLTDDELVQRVGVELRAAMEVTAAPAAAGVVRWKDAFPQYTVGHLERVDRIESDVARLPGLALAGAALRGIGIPACIDQGRQAAARVLKTVQEGAPR
jgi:oxygen-dependent protoporphyrinogen oxidase